MWFLLTALTYAAPVAVAPGSAHSCMVRADGSVWCWGGLDAAGLREGRQPSHLTPWPIPEVAPARSVSAGGGLQSCAVRRDGALWCWKVDEAPARIGSLVVAEVSVGEAHTCARTEAGRIWCWGYNGRGQLGDGTTEDRPEPVLVEGISDAVQISAGWYHTCARRASGAVSCWGHNNYGQLGASGDVAISTVPVPVLWLRDAIDLDTGSFHSCAVRATGHAVCWGAGGAGQLGDGTRDGSGAIVATPGVDDAVQIATGLDHSCALRQNGTLTCWGNNESGQLGNEEPRRQLFPFDVADLDQVVAVAAGSQHTCALRADGGIRCFGQNFTGQIGDGTTERRMTPVVVVP